MLHRWSNLAKENAVLFKGTRQDAWRSRADAGILRIKDNERLRMALNAANCADLHGQMSLDHWGSRLAIWVGSIAHLALGHWHDLPGACEFCTRTHPATFLAN